MWLCAQRRLRSAWASTQSDPSLRCALNRKLRVQALFMRTAWTLIRLGRCPGLSESSLGAHSLCWFCHEAAHMGQLLDVLTHDSAFLENILTCVISSSLHFDNERISIFSDYCSVKTKSYETVIQVDNATRWNYKTNSFLLENVISWLWKESGNSSLTLLCIFRLWWTWECINDINTSALVWYWTINYTEPEHDKTFKMRSAKRRLISARAPAFRSGFSLYACRSFGFLAIYRVPAKADQIAW